MVLRLHETDEARTDEKPIVETEEAGDTNPLSLLIFSPFDSFQNTRGCKTACANPFLTESMAGMWAMQFNPAETQSSCPQMSTGSHFGFLSPPLPFVIPGCLWPASIRMKSEPGFPPETCGDNRGNSR
jgi:hypothetical protein